MLPDFRLATLEPLMRGAIRAGSQVYTDEFCSYQQVSAWGFQHEIISHGAHQYARDADGDGVNEVHVNTAEGTRSVVRGALRPHRGVSQKYLPGYLAPIELQLNHRQRGRGLFQPLLSAVLN